MRSRTQSRAIADIAFLRFCVQPSCCQESPTNKIPGFARPRPQNRPPPSAYLGVLANLESNRVQCSAKHLLLLAPNVSSDLPHQRELGPLLGFGQLVADLARGVGDQTGMTPIPRSHIHGCLQQKGPTPYEHGSLRKGGRYVYSVGYAAIFSAAASLSVLVPRKNTAMIGRTVAITAPIVRPMKPISIPVAGSI